MNEKEIAEIREELEQGGYVKLKKSNKQKKEKPLPPIEFKSSDGFKILVGRAFSCGKYSSRQTQYLVAFPWLRRTRCLRFGERARRLRV